MDNPTTSTTTITTADHDNGSLMGEASVEIMTDNSASMEEEQLVSMMAQEAATYACPDYLSPDYRIQRSGTALEQSIATSLSVVEECAKLVTDLSLTHSRDEEERHPMDKSFSSSCSLMQSPVDVTTPLNPLLRSPRSSTAHLHALYMNETGRLSQWREGMVDWAYMAVGTFGFDRSIVSVAFDLLDRFLAREVLLQYEDNNVSLTREDFQLYSMTCFYIAIKMLDSSHKLSLMAMMDMSRGYFTVVDFEETELEILSTLEWKLNPPTTMGFVRQFLSTSEALGELDDMAPGVLEHEALIQCELVVADPFFISKNKSTVAASILLWSVRKHYPLHHCDTRLRAFSNTTLKPLGINIKSFEFRQVYKHLQQLAC